MKYPILISTLPLLISVAAAQPVVNIPPTNAKVSITIAQEEGALVSDRRSAALPAGRALLRFGNVPTLLKDAGDQVQPAFKGAGTVELLEQQFRYDTGSTDATLGRYEGKTVSVVRQDGKQFTGVLTRSSSGWLLQSDEGLIVNVSGTYVLPKLAEPLVTTPHLEWLVNTATAGTYDVEARYPTNGLSWIAQYRATLMNHEAGGNRVSLRAWLGVTNASGANFRDANLLFQSGKLSGIFASYPYPRPVTLLSGETKQLNYAAADALTGTELLADFSNIGSSTNNTISPTLSLRLTNDVASGLGLPLPSGTLTVWRQDADASLRLLSTKAISPIPVGGEAFLPLATYENVLVTRSVTTRQLNPKVSEQVVSFVAVNKRPTPLTLMVRDNLPANAKITDSTLEPEVRTANSLRFKVELPANDKAEFKYTLQIGG